MVWGSGVCFVLASHFVMTTETSIDRDRRFLHSLGFSSFFFLPQIADVQIKAYEKRFFCHLFEKVSLKLSLTSFSHSEKKTYICEAAASLLLAWHVQVNGAEGARKICGRVIKRLTLCCCSTSGWFTLWVALNLLLIPLCVLQGLISHRRNNRFNPQQENDFRKNPSRPPLLTSPHRPPYRGGSGGRWDVWRLWSCQRH